MLLLLLFLVHPDPAPTKIETTHTPYFLSHHRVAVSVLRKKRDRVDKKITARHHPFTRPPRTPRFGPSANPRRLFFHQLPSLLPPPSLNPKPPQHGGSLVSLGIETFVPSKRICLTRGSVLPSVLPPKSPGVASSCPSPPPPHPDIHQPCRRSIIPGQPFGSESQLWRFIRRKSCTRYVFLIIIAVKVCRNLIHPAIALITDRQSYSTIYLARAQPQGLLYALLLESYYFMRRV